jgi:type I restriction enzyme M protein
VKGNVLFFDKKPAREAPWTKKLWIYDLRANKRFTLKTNPLKREDLDQFVICCNGLNGRTDERSGGNRHERKATWSEKKPDGRWRAYDYDELIARDKASLDIFWLKDESLEASDNLPDPGVIAQEIVDDLEAALEQLRLIASDLGNPKVPQWGPSHETFGLLSLAMQGISNNQHGSRWIRLLLD